MYTVHTENGEFIAEGDTPQSAYIAAEKAVWHDKTRVFSRYVEPDYVRRPYERLFIVRYADHVLVVATYELEKQFIFTFSGILAMFDADQLTIPQAQAEMDALKLEASHYSTFTKARIRKLILENFNSEKAEIALVNDKLTIRPK